MVVGLPMPSTTFDVHPYVAKSADEGLAELHAIRLLVKSLGVEVPP